MSDSPKFGVQSSAFSVQRSGAAGSAVDPDNPWLGLASFTEESRAYFHGRDEEIGELSRRVQRKLLTVLFGQSGLGKTSILRAGVVPRLRNEGYCPVYVRIDYSHEALPPSEQVKDAIKQALARSCERERAEGTSSWEHSMADARGGDAIGTSGETLWEFLHHRGDVLRDATGRTLTPLIIFDQFEEIFTLAQSDETGRDRANTFKEELADLVENRAPRALEQKLEKDDTVIDRYDFARADYRILISLREDYLPHLDTLKGGMPSITQNRMRLARMTGTQALDAVVKPGGPLVTPEVARAIVEFVAGARGGSIERLAEIDVEPPLLSVICRELNDRRRALGQAQITAEMVTGNRREILTDFYERSVADLPEPMRRFVEDKLLTKSGFRDNLALETALEEPGVTKPLIDTLVSRRLLRLEDRLGTQRVELTHDVLAEVIGSSRDARQQRAVLAQAGRSARRLRAWVTGLAVAVVVVSMAGVVVVRRQRQIARDAAKTAAQQAAQTNLLLASRLLKENKVSDGLAYLVRAAEQDPTNPVVGPRILSTLVSRNFLLPETAPLVLPAKSLPAVAQAGDGSTLYVQGEDNVIRAIDTARWRIARELKFDNGGRRFDWVLAADNPRVMAVALDQEIVIADPTTGEKKLSLKNPSEIGTFNRRPFGLSRDGRWAAAARDRELWIWDAINGEFRFKLETHIGYFHFGPDGMTVAALVGGASRSLGFSVPLFYSLETGQPVGRTRRDWQGRRTVGFIPAIAPDGKSYAVHLWPNTIQFCDAVTGEPLGEEVPVTLQRERFRSMAFSPDGKRFAVVGDREIQLIDIEARKSRYAAFSHPALIRQHKFTRDSNYLLTSTVDGVTSLWDLEKGVLHAQPALQQDELAPALISPDDQHLYLFGSKPVIYRLGLGASAAEALSVRAREGSITVAFVPETPPRVLRMLGAGADMIDVATGRPTAGGFTYPSTLVPAMGRGSVLTYLSADQRVIVARSPTTNSLRVWRRGSNGNIGADVELEGGSTRPGAVVFHPDGKWVVLAGSFVERRGIPVYDIDTGKRADLITRDAGIWGSFTSGPVFSPDGRSIAFMTTDWDVHVCEFPGGKERFVIHNGVKGTLRSVRFTPDGRKIVTGDTWGTVQFWDATTGGLLQESARHRDQVVVTEFSADGKLAVSRSEDGTAQVWNVASGAPVGDLMVHESTLLSATFSPDGGRVATGTALGLRIWDAKSGQALTETIVRDDKTAVSTTPFSPDGRFVLNGRTNLRVMSVPARFENHAVPSWLLELATACAGKKVRADGAVIAATGEVEKIPALRQRIGALPADAPFSEWGKWFVADQATRSIGPGFTITRDELKTLQAEYRGHDPRAELRERANAAWADRDFAELEAVERETLELVRETDGVGTYSDAVQKVILARVFLFTSKFEEAQSLLETAIPFIKARGFADDSYQVNSPSAMMGAALAGLQRYDEAELYLVRAITVLRRPGNVMSGIQRAAMRFPIEALIQIFELSGRASKADELRPLLAAFSDTDEP